MTQYVIIDAATRRVLSGTGFRDQMGPPAPAPDAEPGTVLMAWQERLDFSAGTGTLVWPDGDSAPSWRDERVLSDELARALAKPYADIDAIVRAAVGERAKEYERREAAARAYVAAGYTGDVPDRVAVWAQYNPTMQQQTPKWAADNIIGRADALLAAQDAMGDQRFVSQYAMRAASTLAELDAAVAGWNGFITALRAQLGLP